MKRTIIALGLLVLLAMSVSAQDEADKGLTGKGFKVGLNMANLSGDDVPDEFETKMGFAFGGFVTYSFSSMIAVQPEVLYSMKGAKADAGNDEYKFKLGYLEIPVLVKVNIPTEGNIAPSIFVGPALGFILSAKESFGDDDLDVKDYMNNSDIGLVLGAGVDIGTGGGGMVTIDGRYTMGMTKIFEEEDVEARNTNISFLIGYSIP